MAAKNSNLRTKIAELKQTQHSRNNNTIEDQKEEESEDIEQVFLIKYRFKKQSKRTNRPNFIIKNYKMY